MEILKEKYSITELSERLGITDHALRYYEKEFNLDIPKDERGRRYYNPEHANVMFQIKSMRDEGLEIKAIKKILQSENVIKEPPPVVMDESTTSIVPVNQIDTAIELKQYFDDFKDHITNSISMEVGSAREQLSKELTKTKLELGACVENSVRKLEAKMEKHFSEVDQSIGMWREKNKGSMLKRFVKKIIR